VRVVDRLAPSLAANARPVAVPQAEANPMGATGNPVVTAGNPVIAAGIPAITMPPAISSADLETAAELLAEVTVDVTAAPGKQHPIVVAALTDPAEVLPQESPAVQAAIFGTADPLPQDAATIPGRIEIVGECLVAEPCIDQFLWALYERTRKEDTIKEVDRYNVKVRKKGKLVTVTRTSTRLVPNDFTWKDPKAAERLGMSMIDYVIGGMEKSFKLKLFYMLHAAENAGLSPGITSAFRDDYRQSIASGLKAASDRSYHGGSSRGGYGHGLAADIVSTKGATKPQRWVTTEALWKWVDANGKDFGIGRPYLDRDPPHVGPIDGQEYASRRGGTKAAEVRKRDKQATDKPAAKRTVAAKSSTKSSNSERSSRFAEARRR
jgi:D-alanyl-D-alanine carboxypeptidase